MKKTEMLKDLKSKDSKNLYSELQDVNKKITELRFKAAFRKLKNYQEISILRKKVARIWTILAQRALQELIAQEKNEKIKANNVKQ